MLHDTYGRQTYQLTASATVRVQPDATADTLIHTALHTQARLPISCFHRLTFDAKGRESVMTPNQVCQEGFQLPTFPRVSAPHMGDKLCCWTVHMVVFPDMSHPGV